MTGPYIVTTTTRKDAIERSLGLAARPARLAVATLEEARDAWDAAVMAMGDATGNYDSTPDEMPESGGTVGSLPDGTVIEVMAGIEARHAMLSELGWPRDAEVSDLVLIDAYNAQQKAAA